MPYMPARLQCLMTMERFVDYLTAVVSHTTCLDQQNLSEGEKSSNLTSVKKLLYIRIKSGAQLDDQLTPNRERAARATRNRKRAIRAGGRGATADGGARGIADRAEMTLHSFQIE